MEDIPSVSTADFVPVIRKRISLDDFLGSGQPGSRLPSSRTYHTQDVPVPNSVRSSSNGDSPQSDYRASSVGSPRVWAKPRLVDKDEFRENLLAVAKEIIGASAKASPVPDSDLKEVVAQASPKVETGAQCDTEFQNTQIEKAIHPTTNQTVSESPNKAASHSSSRSSPSVDAKSDLRKYKIMKRVLRDMVLSALSNSRLIRDELTAILRSDSTHPPRRIQKLISSSPIILSAPNPFQVMNERGMSDYHAVVSITPAIPESIAVGSNHEAIATEVQPLRSSVDAKVLSARVILSNSVSSPKSMDLLFADVCFGQAAGALRFFTPQPSVHPRAFIIVVNIISGSVTGWIESLRRSRYIEAIDISFPVDRSGRHPIPWEIRVRADMSSVVPQWQASLPDMGIPNSFD
jgi:hypothetical protein